MSSVGTAATIDGAGATAGGPESGGSGGNGGSAYIEATGTGNAAGAAGADGTVAVPPASAATPTRAFWKMPSSGPAAPGVRVDPAVCPVPTAQTA